MSKDEVNQICAKALAELRNRGLDMRDRMTMIPNSHYNIPLVAVGPDGKLKETRIVCFDSNRYAKTPIEHKVDTADSGRRFPTPSIIVADYVEHMMHAGAFYEDFAARFVFDNFRDAWNEFVSYPMSDPLLSRAKDLDGKTFLYGRMSGMNTCWTRCREMRLVNNKIKSLGWEARRNILDVSLVDVGPTINSNVLDVRDLKAVRV